MCEALLGIPLASYLGPRRRQAVPVERQHPDLDLLDGKAGEQAARVFGLERVRAPRAMLVSIAIDGEQEQIDHRLGDDDVAHHRSIERLVHTAQPRIPEHFDACCQPQVGEKSANRRSMTGLRMY
ncbi:MAG: hypothetical protein E6J90_16710 [Deltaproteobacteria bacterium]|nr:MAG: hypothetical protein E6J90_16710 [Deltaproteobacteria bacterium]